MNFTLIRSVLFFSGILATFGFANLDTLSHVSSDSSTGWSNQISASLTLNQTGTQNWTSGGENSWSWIARLRGNWSRRLGSEQEWGLEEQLDLMYGKTQIGKEDARKTDDQIFVESLVDRLLIQALRAYGLLRFESQFASGYTYDDEGQATQVSAGWDPMIFTEGLGLGYEWNTPQKFLQLVIRLGGAARQTHSTKWGWADDPATLKIEESKNELGMESMAKLSIQWSKILHFESKITAFTNFDGAHQMDTHWENVLEAKASDYLSFQASLEGRYDYDQSVDMQWRENISIVWTFMLGD